MAPRYPHIKIKNIKAPSEADEDFRNQVTLQAALIRGETSVELRNASSLTRSNERRVRVPFHPKDRPQDEPYEWKYGCDYRDPEPGDWVQPESVREVISDNDVWQGFRFEWVKVLGEGGFGMATLWNVWYDDGSGDRVVIKIPKDGVDIADEARWHERYCGASHIVQPVDVQENARRVWQTMKDSKDKNYDGDKFVANHENILVLEYAEHGNLFDMMAKASFFGIHFPTRLLWEIWECLVKGVAATAYQPSLKRESRKRGDFDRLLKKLENPTKRDYMRSIDKMRLSHDVHFDLEEQNVLVGEAPDHGHNPILKLHDFGEFSFNMRWAWLNWPVMEYWTCRNVPKKNRNPPETFVTDWDSLPICQDDTEKFVGDDFSKGNRVAGRYGTWTNIFLIGQIMEAVITHNYTVHPATTQDYEPKHGGKSGKTYGWRLIKNPNAEEELKEMVMRCQYEEPGSRPTVMELLEKISKRKEQGFEELVEETAEFWEIFWELKREPEDSPEGFQNRSVDARPPSKYRNEGRGVDQIRRVKWWDEVGHSAPHEKVAREDARHVKWRMFSDKMLNPVVDELKAIHDAREEREFRLIEEAEAKASKMSKGKRRAQEEGRRERKKFKQSRLEDLVKRMEQLGRSRKKGGGASTPRRREDSMMDAWMGYDKSADWSL